MIINTIVFTCSAIFLLMFIIVLIQYFFERIYIPYKSKQYDETFEELIAILHVIINSELEVYETDIFDTKGSITNSNFENFYNDLSKRIIDTVAPNFMQQLTKYVTEDAVIKIIARSVKKYLTSKIAGTV